MLSNDKAFAAALLSLPNKRYGHMVWDSREFIPTKPEPFETNSKCISDACITQEARN